MQFKLTYTVSRTFEIPDGASDEEYDAMKETVITGIVGCVFARTFLEWMGTTSDSIDQATLYLRIYFIGSPAFMIYTFGRAIVVARGDTRRPLVYLTISGVLNVILNLILVAGFGLGVAGVAIATVASQVLSAILMSNALFDKSPYVNPSTCKSPVICPPGNSSP